MAELSFHVPFFGAFLVASTVFGVGVGSPYWINTVGKYTGGIWFECVGERPTCKVLVGHESRGYWWMTQAMMAISGIFLVASACFYVMWMTSPYKHWLRLTSSTCNVVAGLVSTCGVVTFGVGHMHNEVLKGLSQRAIPNGWAYWVTVHGSLTLLVLGCINTTYSLSPSRSAYNLPSSTSELTPESFASKDWTHSSSEPWLRT